MRGLRSARHLVLTGQDERAEIQRLPEGLREPAIPFVKQMPELIASLTGSIESATRCSEMPMRLDEDLLGLRGMVQWASKYLAWLLRAVL